jgi:hypothetical protein
MLNVNVQLVCDAGGLCDTNDNGSYWLLSCHELQAFQLISTCPSLS